MDKELNIRKADENDIDSILVVENISFSIPWSREAFIKEISTNSLAYYSVVELDKKIVGYAGMWIILDEVHLTNIAIIPEVRGLKLGELLMRYIMGIAKMHKAERMTLEVRQSNRVAINLYNKLNFEKQGIRRDYYKNPVEDAFIMWVNL